MGKYRTKTIISISTEEFEKKMDEFTESLDGKIIDVKLHSAPESTVKFDDDQGRPSEVFYNIFTAVIIYKPAKHVDTKVLTDKYKKFKKKLKFKNKSKKIDKILA